MRLIDADELLERMKGMNMLFSPKIVIDNMPTAYNVDNVVEELEKEKGKDKYAHGDCKNCRNNCDAYPDDCYPCRSFEGYERYETLDMAIEIVKRGGLNE